MIKASIRQFLPLFLLLCLPLPGLTPDAEAKKKKDVDFCFRFGPEEKPLTISPIGTLLIDGAVFAGEDKHLFPDGVAIPDVRLGVQLAYGQWSAKIEAGLAYGKVGLKDCYLQYDLNRFNFFRAGLTLHHFGYQNSTAACMKTTFIEPICNSVFNEAHQIGISYYHHSPKWYATASVHAEPMATTVLMGPDQLTRLGYGVRTRLVARPLITTCSKFQTGISVAFATPQYARTSDNGDDPHDLFTFGANFPSKVVQNRAIESRICDSRNLFKLTPELMINQGPVALEAQYFWMQVNRKNGLKPYRAQGAYASLRGLLLGKRYPYSDGLAGIGTPEPGSLEAVLGYNYTTLSDSRSGIRGGRVNDASLTLNYYINRFIIAKLRYSYTNTFDRAGYEPMQINAIQARLQIIF